MVYYFVYCIYIYFISSIFTKYFEKGNDSSVYSVSFSINANRSCNAEACYSVLKIFIPTSEWLKTWERVACILTKCIWLFKITFRKVIHITNASGKFSIRYYYRTNPLRKWKYPLLSNNHNLKIVEIFV